MRPIRPFRRPRVRRALRRRFAPQASPTVILTDPLPVPVAPPVRRRLAATGQPLFLPPTAYGPAFTAGVGYAGEEEDEAELFQIMRRMHRGFHADEDAEAALAISPEDVTSAPGLSGMVVLGNVGAMAMPYIPAGARAIEDWMDDPEWISGELDQPGQFVAAEAAEPRMVRAEYGMAQFFYKDNGHLRGRREIKHQALDQRKALKQAERGYRKALRASKKGK